MKGKILVVDDVAETRATLKGILEDEGYMVDVAQDGQQAFEKIKQERYDVVIMDIVMPNMSGVEAVRKIKEYNPDIFVVMMTGEASEDEKKDSIKYGGYVVLRKPFNMDAFLQQVEWFKQVKEMQEEEKRLREYWHSLSGWQKFKIKIKRRFTREKIRLYLVIGVLSIISFFIALGIFNVLFKTQVSFLNMYQTIVGYLERDEQREIQMMQNR